MAVEGPDPRSFGSWDDAFQYPVAAVRGMERRLRSDIDSNKEKLRTLVGYDVEIFSWKSMLLKSRAGGKPTDG